MKKLKIILIVLCIASTVAAVGMMLYSLYYNFRLRKGFREKEYRQTYAEEIAKNPINPQAIYRMFSGNSALIGFDYQDDISSPERIRYYSDISDDSPALVIEKGTIIHVDSSEILNGEYTFRGINSLPADKKGWRLVKPFSADGQGTDDSLLFLAVKSLSQIFYKPLKTFT